ncbi:uncharacterized protein LOC144324002 [Canis aureus]
MKNSHKLTQQDSDWAPSAGSQGTKLMAPSEATLNLSCADHKTPENPSTSRQQNDERSLFRDLATSSFVKEKKGIAKLASSEQSTFYFCGAENTGQVLHKIFEQSLYPTRGSRVRCSTG